ncbi:MAG: PRC-barrel domain-containing protein [Methyloceanibacter sp.]|uniref:PRC-barrel domain-containing protein n=1 Tax=Methyloceanibacter sp. TaxID=1965321 RepID=UPI003D6C8598
MKRLLTGTAIGLLMGLTPALAQTDTPPAESQEPPALQDPAIPPEIMPSEPSEPADPAAPIPGDSAAPAPDKSSEMAPEALPGDEASPPSQSSEAPKSLAPEDAGDADDSASASLDSPQFLSKQESGDFLASSLIGKSVVNSSNESIGSIKDLVTDENGAIIAAVIGHGGFLGLGEKEIAVRFEDLDIVRDEDDDVTVTANLSNETLASAPDYETLAEQEMAVGAADEDAVGTPDADIGDEERTY